MAIPLNPVFSRQRDRAKTNRGPVDTALLTRFLDLDQHASRPFAAERCATPQQFVGAFDRFDTKHQTLLDDNGLTDIKTTQRPSDAQPVLDVRRRLRIWADFA